MRQALFVIASLLALAQPGHAQTWLYEADPTLPSTDTGWGGPVLNQDGTRLFIPRRADGLLVWDTKTATGTTIADSTGANAIILVPSATPTVTAATKAYAAMTDGSVLTIDLATLKPIGRSSLGVVAPSTAANTPNTGNFDTGLFEPTQNHVHLLARDAEKTTWVTLDAATGEVLGRTEFNSKRMDRPATDGEGHIFAPMRDKNLLQQLDAKDLSIQKTWKLGDCQQPAAVEWDAATSRILLGCRGGGTASNPPVFIALNPDTGIVATIPIGAGVNGLALDSKRHLIVTANGAAANLSVIRQDGPDGYSLVETISTRPMARGLALDPNSSRLFTVAASVTRPAPGADKQPHPPFFHPNSFTILSFRPN